MGSYQIWEVDCWPVPSGVALSLDNEMASMEHLLSAMAGSSSKAVPGQGVPDYSDQ